MRKPFWLFGIVWLATVAGKACSGDDLRPISLTAKTSHVQPMTGIVLWTTNEAAQTAPIQLEFSYLSYDRIVRAKGEYDWRPVEKLLNEVAGRKHQLILRWHDTYVGKPSGVPAYLKSLPGYRETIANSEKKRTGFPDWSHPEMQAFVLEFFGKFAEKYDRDPRIAFVQVGFGLWSEYHIYDGPMKLGRTFPSVEYQRTFALRMDEVFRDTPWMISVDAAGDHTPFASDKRLLSLAFGLFDDSFNHARHSQENEPNWDRLGRDRWKIAPTGGEFSFFEDKDQKEALTAAGPHGVPFAQHAAKFHVSFMIGDGQPEYQKPDRIRKAGLSCGYRFRVTRFDSSVSRSVVTIQNTGIAPIYHDAFPAVNGVWAKGSLKGLPPKQEQTFEIATGGTKPILSIESDRLVAGQHIEFDADLP